MENYYPNCQQADLCIHAVRTTLAKYATEFSDSKVKCISEALKITMSSNDRQFLDGKYIMYLDANNLYGWAMSQYLPTGNCKWMSDREIKQIDLGKCKTDGKRD